MLLSFQYHAGMSVKRQRSSFATKFLDVEAVVDDKGSDIESSADESDRGIYNFKFRALSYSWAHCVDQNSLFTMSLQQMIPRTWNQMFIGGRTWTSGTKLLQPLRLFWRSWRRKSRNDIKHLFLLVASNEMRLNTLSPNLLVTWI